MNRSVVLSERRENSSASSSIIYHSLAPNWTFPCDKAFIPLNLWYPCTGFLLYLLPRHVVYEFLKADSHIRGCRPSKLRATSDDVVLCVNGPLLYMLIGSYLWLAYISQFAVTLCNKFRRLSDSCYASSIIEVWCFRLFVREWVSPENLWTQYYYIL